MRVVVFGYISRDRNRLPDGQWQEHVGGKGLFIATALAQSGVETDLVTWLPTDDAALAMAVEAYPINLHVIPVQSGTRNQNDHQASPKKSTTVIPDEVIGIQQLNDGMRQAVQSAEKVIIAPSLHSQLSLELIQFLNNSCEGGVVADLGNYFRELKSDGELVPRFPWPEQANYLRHLTSVFVSAEDIDQHLAQGESFLSLAHQFTEQGPTEAIITRGAEGAFIYQAEGNEGYDIPAYRPRRIVDPTGAGDTFLGAYVAERLRTDNPLRAGKFGAMAASLKLNYSGPLRETQEQIDQAITERESPDISG